MVLSPLGTLWGYTHTHNTILHTSLKASCTWQHRDVLCWSCKARMHIRILSLSFTTVAAVSWLEFWSRESWSRKYSAEVHPSMLQSVSCRGEAFQASIVLIPILAFHFSILKEQFQLVSTPFAMLFNLLFCKWFEKIWIYMLSLSRSSFQCAVLWLLFVLAKWKIIDWGQEHDWFNI